MVDYVLDELLPQMPLKIVHNSMLMIYSLIWPMKNRGEADRLRINLETFVIEPFYKFYGEGASTFCLPLYKLMQTLKDIIQFSIMITNTPTVSWALTFDAILIKNYKYRFCTPLQ